MSFNTLPTEILTLVLSNEDQLSLKALRLVNKTFAVSVAPLLFADLDVWLHPSSLARLTSVVEHEVFRRYVRRVTVTNECVPKSILTPAAWVGCLHWTLFTPTKAPMRSVWRTMTPEKASNIDLESFEDLMGPKTLENDKRSARLLKEGWDTQRCFSAWKLQRDTTVDYNKFIDGDDDIQAFTGMLMNCSGLFSIHLSCGGTGGIKRLRRSGLQDYIHGGKIKNDNGRALFAILSAASATEQISTTPKSTGIRSLIMDEWIWDHRFFPERWLVVPLSSFSQAAPASIVGTAIPVFKDVKILTLSTPTDEREDAGDAESESVEQFLKALPQLQHLTLLNPSDLPLRLCQARLSTSTTSLRTLELKNCMIDLANTQMLFSTNAETLKTLRLKDISLLGGSLVDFFTSLRDTLRLEDVSLKGFFVEIRDRSTFCCYADLRSDCDEKEEKAKRDLAREGIKAFLLRERNTFPHELVDQDSMNDVEGEDGVNAVIRN